MLSELSSFFLQIAANNSTTLITPSLVNAVHDNTTTISTAISGVVVTAAGLVGKHLYDTKKSKETLGTAADIDVLQQKDIADNYNDFTDSQANIEMLLSMIVNNKDMKISDILDTVIDPITKETLGLKMITHCRNVQKYNTEYYKNLSFKSLTTTTTLNIPISKNPLENTKNMLKTSLEPSSTTTTPQPK